MMLGIQKTAFTLYRLNYGFEGLSFDDLRSFRSMGSKLTGHGETHLNPEGVLISNGPLGSGLPQAQGLALGDKILGNNRLTVCTISDGGSMEGEAKEAFAAIPGLAARGFLNPFVLAISDNNTKLSGRIDEDSFSMAPTFHSLEILGWEVIKVDNGHDLQKVFSSLEKAFHQAWDNPIRPIALHFKTIKGYGVRKTQQSTSGGHGYPLKAYDESLSSFIDEIYGGKAPKEFQDWAKDILNQKRPRTAAKDAGDEKVKKEKVQAGFTRALLWAAEKYPIFSLSADLQGSTGAQGLHRAFKDRWVEVGVAESNMISTAIGLSKLGLIPVVDTFSQFGVTKGNLPLIMSALSQAPLIALFSHTGFQDAADGASHQATTYLAATSALPHTTVICCSCSYEAETFMRYGITNMAQEREAGKIPKGLIFFMGREEHPQYYGENVSFEWGRAQVLRRGKDVTLVSCGPLVGQALEAAAHWEREDGIQATVINNPFPNQPDIETMAEELAQTGGRLITLEDHQVIGGMGAQLIHALVLNGIKFQAQSLGVEGTFGQSAYKAAHLYDFHELNFSGIQKAWRKFQSS